MPTSKENPEVLKALIRAYKKALDFVKSNRAEAGKIHGEAVGIPAEVATQGFKNAPDRAYDMKIIQDLSGLPG